MNEKIKLNIFNEILDPLFVLLERKQKCETIFSKKKRIETTPVHP
jgi:hypothetical protein